MFVLQFIGFLLLILLVVPYCIASTVCIPIVIVRDSRWLLNRMFVKYRHKYHDMHMYEVSLPIGLFGPPFQSKVELRAMNVHHAARRYFKRYRRVYKESSDHEDLAKHYCNKRWAHLRITDMNTGFTEYLGQH